MFEKRRLHLPELADDCGDLEHLLPAPSSSSLYTRTWRSFAGTLVAMLLAGALICSRSLSARLPMGGVGSAESLLLVPGVCDASIVKQTCTFINDNTKEYFGGALDSDASVVNVRELSELLIMTESSLTAYLQKAGVPNIQTDPSGPFAAECTSLCNYIINDVPSFTVPPSSDVGCYNSSAGYIRCDVDLSPQAIANIHFPLHEMADMANIGSSKSGNSNHQMFKGSFADVPVAIARLFRIYLLTTVETDLGSRSADADFMKKIDIKAQAVVATALNAMSFKSIPHLVEHWFGNNDVATRREIRFLLSASLNFVLSNVEYRYPNEFCTESTYAYVNTVDQPPCVSLDDCAHFAEAGESRPYPFLVSLCDLHFHSPEGAQIKTMVHEAMHHRPMSLADFAYGLRACEELAKTSPAKALNNADSLCYFVADANVAWAKFLGFIDVTPGPSERDLLDVDAEAEPACFLGESLAQVENIGMMPLHELRAGDRVLVGADMYEPVLGFLHAIHEAPWTRIATIAHASGVFRASASHLLFAVDGSGRLVSRRAADFRPGDFLASANVSPKASEPLVVLAVSFGLAADRGLVAPLTASGRLVVDEVLGSNYASPNERVFLPHAVAHSAFFLARVWHKYFRIGVTHEAKFEGTSSFAMKGDSMHPWAIFLYKQLRLDQLLSSS